MSTFCSSILLFVTVASSNDEVCISLMLGTPLGQKHNGIYCTKVQVCIPGNSH